ncbi:MAG: CRISPR-associated protein Csx14 [Methanomassiliicoccales archaeon]|nr:CRISPR-associated protein Csx14 [Methanomassiliicoccales archaeon]
MDPDAGRKLKASLIAPVGTTPPVVTEMAQWLIKSGEVFLSDVALISTMEEEVRKSAKLVESALKASPWRINSHLYETNYTDVASDRSAIDFISLVSKIIRNEKVRHHAERVYLCISGGRKTQSVLLALCGQLWAVDGVYHVVMPSVSTVNMELERARNLIAEHFSSPSPLEFYEKHSDVFNKLMFPPADSYSVVELPIIPYSPEMVSQLGNVLRNERGVEIERCGLSANFIHVLVRHKILHSNGSVIRPTKKGYELGQLIAQSGY